MPGGRPGGIAFLLALLAGAPLLAALPGDPGAIRLAGLSLAWWYAAVVAPLAGLGVTLLVLMRRRSDRVPTRRPPA
jgi:hypothetical protein